MTDTPDLPDNAAAPDPAADVGTSSPTGASAPHATDRQTPRAAKPPRTTPQGNSPAPKRSQRPAPPRHHPVLDQLAALYPALFGEVFRPLKRGIFEDLLAAQPQALDRESLKAALALHARSTRYLTVVASGQQRHDLNGQAVEALTAEQVHHALIEVFRRRGARSREDLRPKLRERIAQAFEASGLSADDYAARVVARDEEVNQLTQDALLSSTQRSARDQALLRAFEASGKPLNEFADMYGLHVLEANRTLERARAKVASLVAVQPPDAPADPSADRPPP